MSDTPVFDAVVRGREPRPFKTEYTDRYTPEVARHEGWLYGMQQMREEVIKLASAYEKPTKQLQELIKKVEAIAYE